MKNKVAVYGTLKKGFGNNIVMQNARGEFIEKDFVEVESLKDVGYPCVKFNTGTKKWLEVEIYSVDDNGVEGYLDTLEGYIPGSDYNLYNRIEVTAKSGKKVEVYEINNEINDELERFYTHNDGENFFYNWK